MVKIRVEQLSPRLGRLEDNLRIHFEALQNASREGVRLVVFPELSLTGYLLKDLVPEIALTREDLLEFFSRRCEGIRNLEAVVGFAEESETHRFYNSAAFLRWGPHGDVELVHVHRKVHLPTYGLFDEGRYYSPGRFIRSFQSRSMGRVGILICEDAWHLSLPLLLAVDGPDLDGVGVLIIPSSSPARGVLQRVDGIPESHRTWIHLTETLASLLGVLVVYVNRAGVEDGLNFSGGSRIISPSDGCLAEAALLETARFDVEIDWPDSLRRYRIGAPLRAADDLDLLRRELLRLLETGRNH